MAEPKWTPGPWRIGKNPHDVLGADDRGVVIDVDMDIPDDMAAANARLIAAAPELYAELTDLVMRFESACRHAGSDDEFIGIATSKARAVLAKAGGETP